MGSARQILMRGNVPEVQDWVRSRFGVSLDYDEAVRVIPPDTFFRGPIPRCDDSCIAWVKNKLTQKLPAGDNNDDSNKLGVQWNELHVFFMHIEETAEMLDRLKTSEAPCRGGGVARTKLNHETNQVVRPIDRTAERVSQFIRQETKHAGSCTKGG